MKRDENRWKILIIDDDEEDFLIAKEMISSTQTGRLRLDWASSYSLGLEKVTSGGYDAALVDYYLGAESGIDLIRAAGDAGVDCPFILLTGMSNPDLDRQALQAGAADYLVKGELTPALLERALRYAIKQHQSQQQHHQQEQAARRLVEQQKNWYETVLHSSPQAMLVVDVHMTLIFQNPRAEEIFGLEIRSAIPTASQADEAAADAPVEATAGPLASVPFHETITQGKAFRDIELAINGTGEKPVYLMGNIAPILDDDGCVQGAVGVFSDVSAARAADRALRDSELRFRRLADSMPQLVWTANPDGRVDYYNNRTREYDGINRTEEGIFTWAPVVHPDDLDETVYAWKTAVRTGKVYQVEHRVRMKSGEYRWHLSRGFPVRERGRIIKWYGTATDIHHQKQVEEDLRNSQARLVLSQSATGIGTWELEPVNLTMEWSPECYNLFEMKPGSDFIGHLQRHISEQDIHLLMTRVEECIKKGKTEMEFPFITNGRKKKWVYSRAVAVSRPDGMRLLGVSYDITDRKRREEHNRFLVSFADQLMSLSDPDQVRVCVITNLQQYLEVARVLLEDCPPEGEPANAPFGLSLSSGELAALNRGDIIRLRGGLPDAPLSSAGSAASTQMPTLPTATAAATPAASSPTASRPRRQGTLLLAPRMAQQRRVGAVLLVCRERREWKTDELSLVASAMNLFGLALDRARYFRQVAVTEKRLRLALAGSPILIYTADRDLRYTWIYNPVYGLSDEEIIGRRDDELIDSAEAAKLIAIKQEVIETGERNSVEVQLHLDDTLYTYLMTVEPILAESGEVTGVTVAAVDISDLRRLEARQMLYDQNLELSRLLMNHRERERVQIARDLHDGLLQELIAINMGLADAVQLDEKTARMAALRGIQETVQHQIGEVRLFCNALRPPALAPFGLEKAIRSHLVSQMERHPALTIRMNLMHDGQRLPEEMRLAFYRIHQELMNNVLRHAQASEVTVQLLVEEEWVTLEVIDNGVGFDLPADWREIARGGHLGLIGIRERVELIGGELYIDSAPGRGTYVSVVAPVGQRE